MARREKLAKRNKKLEAYEKQFRAAVFQSRLKTMKIQIQWAKKLCKGIHKGVEPGLFPLG